MICLIRNELPWVAYRIPFFIHITERAGPNFLDLNYKRHLIEAYRVRHDQNRLKSQRNEVETQWRQVRWIDEQYDFNECVH